MLKLISLSLSVCRAPNAHPTHRVCVYVCVCVAIYVEVSVTAAATWCMVIVTAGGTTSRGAYFPTSFSWMSASVLFFVSGTTVAANKAPIRQNAANVRKHPDWPVHLVSSLDTYVTTNTRVQLAHVVRLVPMGFT